jgi:hypothetical protein
MTNEAPHMIGLISDGLGNWALATIDEADFSIRYTLTTHALAMVAAAYQDASRVDIGFGGGISGDYYHYTFKQVSKSIRARTPDDAQAALDALLRAERVKALREAAEIVRSLAPRIEHDSTQDDRMHESILERAARHIERAVE